MNNVLYLAHFLSTRQLQVFQRPFHASIKVLTFLSFTGDRLTEGPFRIDPNSGIITLVGQLDKSKVMYRLNITATDNGRCCGGKTSRSNRGLVVVEVKDINNNAPRFPSCGEYKPTVLEREDVGTSVIRVSIRVSLDIHVSIIYNLTPSMNVDIFSYDDFYHKREGGG